MLLIMIKRLRTIFYALKIQESARLHLRKFAQAIYNFNKL